MAGLKRERPSPTRDRAANVAAAWAPLLFLAPLLVLPMALAQDDDAGGPLAFFTIAPQRPSTGEDVVADADHSEPSPAGTRIVEYAWRWQEDEEFEVANETARHSYSQGGIHVVTLRVTDDAGLVAFANQTVLVRGASPRVYFTFDSIERDGVELVVTANATFSAPSRGAQRIVSYEWDWDGPGDEYEFEAGEPIATHRYVTPGNYLVFLRVTDDENRTRIGTNPVVVESTFLTRIYSVWEARDTFFAGAKLTLYLAVVSTIVGFVLSVVVALLRISRLWILRWPASWYIEIIRGTPLLVQVLIAWLVLPQLGVKLPILQAGLLALIVNTSAYQAEAIRAGIQAIPTGQMEAATSLGMTYMQSMRYVILPQAFRLVIPPLGNEFIILLKDTSLVSLIGVVELTQAAQIFSARTFLVLEAYLGVALIYFVMTYSISLALRYVERRVAIPGLGLGGTP